MAKKKEEEVPSLLTGTLPNIKETGEPLTDVQNRINADESSYHPDKLVTFQKVMSGIADRVYKERQNADLNTASQYFNPTQMSGSNYASVLGWLEGNRGRSISDMYNTTMKTYVTQQEMIQSDLQNLRTMKYNIQNNIQAFKLDLIKNAPGVYEKLSNKDKKSIEVGSPSKNVYSLMDDFSYDVYDRQKKIEDMKLQWQKEEHDLAMQQGNEAQNKRDYITNIQGAMNWLAQKRQNQGFSEGDIKNQEMIDQGLVSGEQTGTSKSMSMYNNIDDVWTAAFEVLKTTPEASLKDVLNVLSLNASPSERAMLDISGNVEAGISSMRNFTTQLEQKYGGKSFWETAVPDVDVPQKLYDAYWDADIEVMKNQWQ